MALQVKKDETQIRNLTKGQHKKKKEDKKGMMGGGRRNGGQIRCSKGNRDENHVQIYLKGERSLLLKSL